MKSFYILFFSLILSGNYIFAQTVTITVDPTQNQHTISPWIYGKNNSLSDNPAKPLTASDWALINDAGVRMFRDNGGNNSTKYNWRKKLSSHPDWYNNVYSHDWDYTASTLFSNTQNTQILMAFQLLGYAASNTNNNFDDYDYTQANGPINTSQNWAGGGGPVAYGGNGGSGDPSLYLETWPADSTVGILDQWTSLGLDANRYVYWNMDNEPGIWEYTHDDVAGSPNNPTAEDYIQKYVAVAKAVKSKNSNLKLLGPVSPNEWQWYTWNNSKVSYNGSSYCWMEYFIMRIAEEQQATGIKLLDVLDVHFYPGTQGDPTGTLQLHRVWFDQTYNYPGANGVKVSGSLSWDNTITKEYFFERCNQWLTQYMGPDHGVRFSVSEYGSIDNSDPNVVACWYASTLGTFAQNPVEVFTPWNWYIGQWEILHLFSNYFGKASVQASSSLDSLVSGYASLTGKGDSLIVVVVNRNQTSSNTVTLDLQNFTPSSSVVNGYQLASLPSSETFVSKTNNALTSKTFSVSSNSISMTVPSLSVTLIQIPTSRPVAITGVVASQDQSIRVFPNPAREFIQIESSGYSDELQIRVEDASGRVYQSENIPKGQALNVQNLTPGMYFLKIRENDRVSIQKIIKQ